MFDCTLNAVLNDLDNPLVITNEYGNILSSNTNFSNIISKEIDSNATIQQFIDSNDAIKFQKIINEVLQKGKAEFYLPWNEYLSGVKNHTTIFNISETSESRLLFIIRKKNNEEDISLLNRIYGQEAEKERLSKDLHDGLGQELNVIHMFTHALKKIDSKTEDFQNLLDELLDLSNKSIDTLEDVIKDEFPKGLRNSGLFKELQQLMLRFKKVLGSDVEFQVFSSSLNFDSIEDFVQINIFRIVQEFFTNSLKYSKATIFHLKIHSENEYVNFTLSDNGKGFDVQLKNQGSGLVNMEDRLKVISADYHFESNSSGTQLQFSIYAK